MDFLKFMFFIGCNDPLDRAVGGIVTRLFIWVSLYPFWMLGLIALSYLFQKV